MLHRRGITGRGVLETYHCGDITGVAFFDVLTLICVHLKYTSAQRSLAFFTELYTLEPASTVPNIRGKKQSFPTYGSVMILNARAGERLFVARMTYLLLAVGSYTGDRRNVERGRHVVDDRVKKLLDTLVLVRGSAYDGNDRVRNGLLTECGLDPRR